MKLEDTMGLLPVKWNLYTAEVEQKLQLQGHLDVLN